MPRNSRPAVHGRQLLPRRGDGAAPVPRQRRRAAGDRGGDGLHVHAGLLRKPRCPPKLRQHLSASLCRSDPRTLPRTLPTPPHPTPPHPSTSARPRAREAEIPQAAALRNDRRPLIHRARRPIGKRRACWTPGPATRAVARRSSAAESHRTQGRAPYSPPGCGRHPRAGVPGRVLLPGRHHHALPVPLLHRVHRGRQQPRGLHRRRGLLRGTAR